MAPASFLVQADALFRKSLAFQKRNIKTNVTLTTFPAFLCILIVVIEAMVNSQLDSPKYHCGCKCVPTNGSESCRTVCGIEHSTPKQAGACAIPNPNAWPALLQVPAPPYRALPGSSCWLTRTCPATSPFTGASKSIATSLVSRILKDAYSSARPSDLSSLPYLGTQSWPESTNFVESAYLSQSPIHVVLPRCPRNLNSSVSVTVGNTTFQHKIDCVQSLYTWRESLSTINKELFQGPDDRIPQILCAYDFSNSRKGNFNVTVWYNSSFSNLAKYPRLLRVPKSLNMVSNAFLRQFEDENIHISLDFLKEMPKGGQRYALNLSSVGPLLFAWVIQLLLPVFITSLVYEKQHKLRIMMKMHGLGDGPYWLISYGYFLVISAVYMIWFSCLGSAIGLEIFQRNSYSVQLVFYVVYMNLQIAFAFLAATIFSDAKIATVIGYIYVFGSGLLGAHLLQNYIEDTSFPRGRLMFMELVPGFSLYHGLYELSQYAVHGRCVGASGMTWSSLNDGQNGMKGTLSVMTLEWMILLLLSFYFDQVLSAGNGIARHPLFFLGNFKKRRKQSSHKPIVGTKSSIFVNREESEILKERHRVKNLLKGLDKSHPLICYKLKKVFSGPGICSAKYAVRSLSLAVPQGECFGLLGPNGAGKSTLIRMMAGFLSPSSGTALIGGVDVRLNMDQVYTRIGICPQQDLIWEELTGREHLLFYGRLRNLTGQALEQEVEKCLRSMNLYEGNVGDQLAGRYSGGMKRRLSVAISLIGYTQVVFMDEPTTGLDPESRNSLWQIIKEAKRNRAIILTTHSMEEADFLCDRIGIIVDGSLQCLGSSKQLKTIYGGSYILTISANPIHWPEVELMVRRLSRYATKIYDIGGTQKFRLPKQGLRISHIFQATEELKRVVKVEAFTVTNASFEDVFLNVVHGAYSRREEKLPGNDLDIVIVPH